MPASTSSGQSTTLSEDTKALSDRKTDAEDAQKALQAAEKKATVTKEEIDKFRAEQATALSVKKKELDKELSLFQEEQQKVHYSWGPRKI